jgi:heme exporter protein D
MSQWASVSDFLAMGGYGLYVWGSYAVCAAALILESAWAARRYRLALQNARDFGLGDASKQQGHSS